MITLYHRPATLEEALTLLARPNTRPLGGGTVLSHPGDESFAVVDLQALGLNKIHKSGDHLEIGATVTLQTLLESPHTPAALKAAIKLETPLNLRNMGTVAGTLVTCDGRSPFAAVMLALDAKITVVSAESSVVSLGDFLPLRVGADNIPAGGGVRQGSLITLLKIPLLTKLAFETVARTLDDKPIICAALAQWPSGRTRLVIGGWGSSPSLALDGNDASGIEEAARNAAHDAADGWASAEYRSDVAAVLAKRCLDNFL
jgi:CO/xanthine dehydrogenase FAD-binding subunit